MTATVRGLITSNNTPTAVDHQHHSYNSGVSFFFFIIFSFLLDICFVLDVGRITQDYWISKGFCELNAAGGFPEAYIYTVGFILI